MSGRIGEEEYERILARATEVIRKRFAEASAAEVDPALLNEILAKDPGPVVTEMGSDITVEVHRDDDLLKTRTVKVTVRATGLSAYLLRMADERYRKENGEGP